MGGALLACASAKDEHVASNTFRSTAPSLIQRAIMQPIIP
jgi:hypothetical protein